MRFLSVCSGIEAASVAWAPLGWSAVAFSEIEPFPCAVLKHHYPSVPNLGDMTTIAERIRAGLVEAPDMLCGGTPCQAFSVAGKRTSLADARGNLSLTFCEIADAIDHVRAERGEQPTIVFWENVPGVLSTKDNAFGCFIAALAGGTEPVVPPDRWTDAGLVLGPKRAVAWRVLDAQYFGVAQRRRRVFVVASARTGFDPAAVLFEFDGVRRDSAPSREAGKVAPTIPSRSSAGGGLGTDFDLDGGVITMAHGQGGAEIGFDRGPTLTCNHEAPIAAYGIRTANTSSNGWGIQGEATHTLDGAMGIEVAHPVAFHPTQDPISSTDGTTHAMGAGSKGGCATVAVGYDTLEHKGVSHANAKKAGPSEALRRVREIVGEEAFCLWCFGVLASLRPTKVLRVEVHGKELRSPTFSRNWLVHNALSRPEDGSAWLMQSLCEAAGIGCPPQGWELAEQFAGELGAYLSELSQPGAQEARFMRDLWASGEGAGLLRQALSAVQEMGRSVGGEAKSARSALQVRRLTCEEAEFLQGFPRGYTAIPWRGKPADQCPDGPRYKALGNSWAVPVVRWIGARIAAAQAVEVALANRNNRNNRNTNPKE